MFVKSTFLPRSAPATCELCGSWLPQHQVRKGYDAHGLTHMYTRARACPLLCVCMCVPAAPPPPERNSDESRVCSWHLFRSNSHRAPETEFTHPNGRPPMWTASLTCGPWIALIAMTKRMTLVFMTTRTLQLCFSDRQAAYIQTHTNITTIKPSWHISTHVTYPPPHTNYAHTFSYFSSTSFSSCPDVQRIIVIVMSLWLYIVSFFWLLFGCENGT